MTPREHRLLLLVAFLCLVLLILSAWRNLGALKSGEVVAQMNVTSGEPS